MLAILEADDAMKVKDQQYSRCGLVDRCACLQKVVPLYTVQFIVSEMPFERPLM